MQVFYKGMSIAGAREVVPLDWAMSTGDLGIAHMLLAERTGNAQLAKTALAQIELALTTMRDAGHAQFTAFYSAQVTKARALVERLGKR